MTVGPIQMIAIGFEDFKPTGKILPALAKASEEGVIRVIDLQFVYRDRDGSIVALETTGLSDDETIEFGAVIGGLIGAGMGGEEGAIEGAIEGALAAASHSYGMTAADVLAVAEGLPAGGAAAMLMIEHTWATEFRNATREAGGFMMAQGFLTPETLLLVGAELEAQVAAVESIVIADMIEEESADRIYNALVAAAEAEDLLEG